MELIYLLGSSLGIMTASLIVVIFVSKRASDWVENNIRYLVTFSSGVFLVISYDLIVEAFEFGGNKAFIIISILVGFLIFFIFERLYPEIHCHHNDEKCINGNNRPKSVKRVMTGDALHNISDGLLLAPVFVVDIKLGIIAAFGIFVHELVQEMSEFFILKSCGYSNKEALIKNFLISSTILIGSLLGFYFSSFEYIVGPLLGFAAGAFIYILINDLIPESVKHSRQENKYFNYLSLMIAGILVILTVNMLSKHFLEEIGLDSHGHLEGENLE